MSRDGSARHTERVLVAWLVASLLACSSSTTTEPTTVPGTLGPGRWGSPDVALEVPASDSATVRFDFCAEGKLPSPVLLTPDGRFDVAGTYVRNIGPSIQSRSARYIGLWRPSSLTLAVVLSDPIGPNEATLVGPFDLSPSHPGPAPRTCPIAY